MTYNTDKFTANCYDNNEILQVSPGVRSFILNRDKKHVFSLKYSTDITQDEYNVLRFVQGIFKLQLHKIKISKTCSNYLQNNLKDDVHLKFKWDVLGFQDSTVSPNSLKSSEMILDFSIKYNMDINEQKLNSLKDCTLGFEISAVTPNYSISLGKCEYKISNILEKLNSQRHYILHFENHTIEENDPIISLSISYRLRCNKKHLSELMSRVEQEKDTTDPLRPRTDTHETISSDLVNIFEIRRFKEGLNLVLNRNKALKTTQSEISNELSDRVEWLKKEADWKRTLQETELLKGRNMDDVQWRQWRDDETAHINSRIYPKQKVEYEPVLTITINELIFRKKCKPVKNESITKIFIEYSFLGQKGPDMETPFSLPKPKGDVPVRFNFTKKFPIHIENDYHNCILLADMVKNKSTIKFVVVSEPEENPNKPIQTCQQIGYAKLCLSELVNLLNNSDKFDLDVMYWEDESEIIGTLVIEVDGILAMRRMALLMMAPVEYKNYL